MYVGGDPVNYHDPSGRNRFFGSLKVFKRVLYVLAGKYQTYSGRSRNVAGIRTFMAKHPTQKGEMAITALAHGRGGMPVAEGRVVTAAEYVSAAKKAGFDTSAYDLHLIVCESGGSISISEHPYVEQVHKITARAVYGYFGEVATEDNIDLRRPIKDGKKITTSVFSTDGIFKRTKDFQYNRVVADVQGVRSR